MIEKIKEKSKLDTQKLIDMNYRALTLLGYATALVCEFKMVLGCGTSIPLNIVESLKECDQFLKNVENVVYFDKPMQFSKDEK